MKSSILSILTAGLCLLSLSLQAQATGVQSQSTIRDDATGEVFPGQVTFDHDGKSYTLDATGTALRKKLIVKVYAIASYLQKDAQSTGDKFQTILDDNNAKQLTLRWLREGPLDKIRSSYNEAFQKVFTDSERNHLQGEINTFTGFFTTDARKGDEYIIRSLPGGYVEVLINGKKVGSLTNAAFAKGLWNVWFGQNSIVNREHLVSQLR